MKHDHEKCKAAFKKQSTPVQADKCLNSNCQGADGKWACKNCAKEKNPQFTDSDLRKGKHLSQDLEERVNELLDLAILTEKKPNHRDWYIQRGKKKTSFLQELLDLIRERETAARKNELDRLLKMADKEIPDPANFFSEAIEARLKELNE